MLCIVIYRLTSSVSTIFHKLKQPLLKMESIADEANNHFVNYKDLKILVLASIQTLKRENKKCGREEVYRLVNDSINKDITEEVFELILNSMIDNHSVNLNVIGKRECLSRSKESCQISDDKVDQNDINFAKKFNLFKSSIVDHFDRLKQVFFSELNRFKEELLESNIVDRPQDTSERLVKQLQDHTEFLREELRNKNNMINCLLEQLLRRDDTIFSYKNQVHDLMQKLSDLHTAESNSYNSIDNNDFMNKGDENNNKSNKSQSRSEFYDNTSFNKSFYAEVSIDDVINPYSEPTTELVISSYKSMNNYNNSKSVENNITECDVVTTVINNKIDDSEKRTKETQTGKVVVNKNKQKVFILGDSIVKHIQGWEITKTLDNKQKVYVRQFSGSKVSCMKDYVKPSIRENNPGHIFHIGTNSVPSEKTPQVIAQSIVDLAKSVANDNLQVTVSSIVPRNDQCISS